jgi:CheY-like chemotaxis protein
MKEVCYGSPLEKKRRFQLRLADTIGVPVQTAVNSEETLQKLREEQVGLVFLGLKLPGIDGMEILRRIKRDGPKSA